MKRVENVLVFDFKSNQNEIKNNVLSKLQYVFIKAAIDMACKMLRCYIGYLYYNIINLIKQ